MAKVTVDVENILKKLGEGDKPSYSLKVVKEVANEVESLFRRSGYGIINPTEPKATVTIENVQNDTEDDLQAFVPKFKNSKPSSIKKGDLFLGFSINGKGRPIVVAKVVKGLAYCIALTTTDDEYALMPHNSRFLEEGFYSNSFMVCKVDQIKKKFIGVMDDTRTLNKAINQITEQIKKDLL